MDLSPIRAHEVIYPIFFYGALLFAIWFWTRECVRHGLERKDGVLLPLALTGFGRIGGLLMYSWEHNHWSSDWKTYALFGMRWGSTQYGAIFMGIAVFIVYAKVRRIGVIRLIDLGVPTVAIAFAIGRMGCYASNCCKGILLPSDWQLPPFMPYREQFPASLVTALSNIGIAIFLHRQPAMAEARGKRMGWWFVLTAAGRFLIEFVRESDPVLGPLTLVQCLALPLIGVGIVFVRQLPRRLLGLATPSGK